MAVELGSRVCSIAECDLKHLALGYCAKHYTRLRRNGDPLAGRKSYPTDSVCTVEGCEQPRRKLDLCAGHYTHSRRCGDAAAPFAYKWPSSKKCIVCGAMDWPDNRRRSICSAECQFKKVFLERTGHERPDATACARCGIPIELTRRGRAGRLQRVDTRLCRGCRRNLPSLSTDDLANRDGTGCGLCGEPVEMGLRFPDLMSPSVDHVVPRSRGGDDQPQNLQLAHLRCNLVKGNRSEIRSS